MINSLTEYLVLRFDKQQSVILKATNFADFRSWPTDSNLVGFGDEDVTILLEHFSPVMATAGFYPDKVEEE
ncbi:hypothetical protein ACJMK2_030917 [Sinanodonta woodiana]|uniref:Uncharacterized protein n=1 Tax=Sinanodonta woodiana TaxID=1069815 RepID=A0ABD3WYK8_SINWO